MRKLKKVLALVIAVVIIASLTLPAFAGSSQTDGYCSYCGTTRLLTIYCSGAVSAQTVQYGPGGKVNFNYCYTDACCPYCSHTWHYDSHLCYQDHYTLSGGYYYYSYTMFNCPFYSN